MDLTEASRVEENARCNAHEARKRYEEAARAEHEAWSALLAAQREHDRAEAQRREIAAKR